VEGRGGGFLGYLLVTTDSGGMGHISCMYASTHAYECVSYEYEPTHAYK